MSDKIVRSSKIGNITTRKVTIVKKSSALTIVSTSIMLMAAPGMIQSSLAEGSSGPTGVHKYFEQNNYKAMSVDGLNGYSVPRDATSAPRAASPTTDAITPVDRLDMRREY